MGVAQSHRCLHLFIMRHDSNADSFPYYSKNTLHSIPLQVQMVLTSVGKSFALSTQRFLHSHCSLFGISFIKGTGAGWLNSTPVLSEKSLQYKAQCGFLTHLRVHQYCSPRSQIRNRHRGQTVCSGKRVNWLSWQWDPDFAAPKLLFSLTGHQSARWCMRLQKTGWLHPCPARKGTETLSPFPR